MIRFILFFIIVPFNTILFAQVPDIMWTKTFGGSGVEVGNSVQQSSDGGYIITGANYSHHGIWLIKTDAYGDTLWTNIFGGSDTIFYDGDVGYSVQQTTDGGYIIGGFTDTNGADIIDIWLIKTNVNGDTLWTRTFGYGKGYSVQQTNDGGYIIAGTALIKTDMNGDTTWTKTFGDNLLGGLLYNQGYSVQQTQDDGYVVLGRGTGLIKTNVNGDTMWTKTLEGVGHSVQQTPDGGYIVAGIRDGDVLLIKVAPDVTSIEDNPHVFVTNYQLHQNYPNPFNPITMINYQLPVSSEVNLSIYNVLGQKITTLVDKMQTPGTYEVQWDASGYPSGVYYYQLNCTGGFLQTRKLLLLK
jgi:hypothetical protein